MKPLFRDDSAPADKRATVVARLLVMCPPGYGQILQPFIKEAIDNIPDHELDALLIDVDGVKSAAESGDIMAVVDTARKYGASEDQIGFYSALLPGQLKT